MSDKIPLCHCHQARMVYDEPIYLRSEDVTLWRYKCALGGEALDFGPEPHFAPAERVKVSLPPNLSRHKRQNPREPEEYFAHIVGPGYSADQYRVLPEGSDRTEIIHETYIRKAE